VFLTFDDGSDFDVRDIDHPEFGTQRSFLGILQDSAAGLDPDRAGSLHATTFVIASEEARRIMDARSLRGRGWIGSDWWAATDRGGRIAIESHGWDHNHPDLGGAGRGGFENIDTDTLCTQQVIRAAEAIGAVTGRPPVFFAYPYGQSSAYLRETWFPGFTGRHGCRAAFGTEPAHVSAEANRWNLPRYVCGRDWQTPDGLQAILDAA
jgi:peptidoglycan/xylan/chitin deacetylase (PgdA/CDA1 family)